MSKNPSAKLIFQVLQAENLKLMQSNDFVSAKNVVEAIVWFKNILESNIEEEKPSPEETRAKQAMQLIFPLPKDVETPDTPEAPETPKQEQEAKQEKVVIKFRKTTQKEAKKRKDWLLNTIKAYNGITESQLLGLYITSKDINHTEAELSKTNPEDKEVRGWALATRYIYSLIEKERVIYINEKGYLFAI